MEESEETQRLRVVEPAREIGRGPLVGRPPLPGCSGTDIRYVAKFCHVCLACRVVTQLLDGRIVQQRCSGGVWGTGGSKPKLDLSWVRPRSSILVVGMTMIRPTNIQWLVIYCSYIGFAMVYT